MRVLVTGRGSNGSWEVRGVQLGGAIGATVLPNAPMEVIKAHDVIVVVKRPHPDLANRIFHSGKMIVWDTVDWYPQPSNKMSIELIRDTNAYAQSLGAHYVIAATKRMADDIQTPYWIPHHGWERGVVKIRHEIRIVGYEGSARYVESIAPAVDTICQRIGAKFVINPRRYMAADVILALRSPEWTSYATEHWKSCIKLSNAVVTGMPFICSQESGYYERQTGEELFLSSMADLQGYLEWLRPQHRRQKIQTGMLRVAHQHRLATIAKEYLDLLRYLWINRCHGAG